MLNLRDKIQQCKSKKDCHRESRISVRDKLLVREVQELEQNLPKTCRVNFSDPSRLSLFILTVTPDEGHWAGGKYKFLIDVPEEYNIVPPHVHCQTTIWHPNINEVGEVCLSILRQNSIDGLGWAPTRKLTDVVWGLNSLFSDLLNFNDPLNIQAAEQYEKDKSGFVNKVKDYIQRYAR